MIPPHAHISAMAAYALADLGAPAGKRLISLSQNECLRPPSPMAIEAAARAARDQHMYPDPDWTDLRNAIGEVHAIDPAQIVCGNGSLDLIGCIARAYLDTENAALAPAHAYPFFRTATQLTGARFDTPHQPSMTADVDGLLEALRPDTRVVFVANPGNPTGTRTGRTGLLTLRDNLPDDVLLVIDEAYGEFADHRNESMFDLMTRGDTVVLRTFSKAYGLAGARVGWGLFPPAIAGEIRKLLNPNNASGPSQSAAVGALRDQIYMRETCLLTASARDAFINDLAGLNLSIPASFTNFTLIGFPSTDTATRANAYLTSEGVVLRSQTGAGLPHCLRATAGVADDMAIAASLLKDWCKREASQ